MGKTYLPIAVMGFIVAVAAGAAAVCAALGNRWGFWDYRTGLLILKWAAYGGAVGAVIALIGGALAWLSHSHRGLSLSLIGLLIALVVLGIPWQYRQQAGRVPPIHDITTDVSNPPRFVAILPLRKSAINTTEYGGPAIAAQQRAAYPDIVPLELALPPAESFKKALAPAQAMGWQIVVADEQEGRIEATDTTFWFGFKDDIVVRITATGKGSQIDVRSLSRVGRSDIGANAKRIRKYLNELPKTKQ